jgi:predicted alpha/beta hydrolase
MRALRQEPETSTAQDLTLPARDGFPLAATHFPGSGRTVLVIHAATGVPRAYYRGFAEYAASRGVAVVTYDYRGIGGSRPTGTLRQVRATMRDWAELDANAVMDWALRTYPGRRLAVVGHSFGGQVLGLLSNTDKIDRVALVASQVGYWHHFAPRDQVPAFVAMHILLPTLSHLLGYFPSSKVGLGEDLPKGVALEWARWCRSRNYLFDHLTPTEREGYNRFRAPLLAYKITDDTFASADSVNKLLPFYPSAQRLLRTVSPQDVGVRTLGHFGPFRSMCRDTLWPEIFAWVEEGKAPAGSVGVG